MNEYVIKFFKDMGFYNEDYFNKIKNNTTVVDKDYNEIIDFVGFYPDGFKLVLPKIKTMSDVLIWIHEYSHALFPEDSNEIFSNIMEAYFINMYIEDIEEVKKLKEQFNSSIKKSKSINHVIAQKIKLNIIRG